MKKQHAQLVLLSVMVIGMPLLVHSSPDAAPLGEVLATPQLEEKILVSISNGSSDDTLYTLAPDGSGKTHLFDFHGQPKFTTGEVFAPRISADGKYIYFHSEYAYIYTPARRNAFRIMSLGSGLDQITPGPESGIWGETGNSTVSGFVKHGDGTPWMNCSVYLEGMDMVYSAADGSFAFHNVPAGVRWLVAYRPALDAWDSTTVNVISGVDNTGLTLTPNSSYRMNFEFPVPHGDRIYYCLNSTKIQWTDLGFSAQHDVYTSPVSGCVTMSQVKAFDVAPSSGKLAIFDYHGDGCTDNRGIYVTDKDGGNKQLLLDMWNDSNWNEPLESNIFWSPDESLLAFKGSYNWYQCLVIYGADGSFKSRACATDTNTTLTLHGWSPDGGWLLYSSYASDPSQSSVAKIPVGNDGALDTSNIVTLLTNTAVHGATWGRVVKTNRIYLPLTLRNK